MKSIAVSVGLEERDDTGREEEEAEVRHNADEGGGVSPSTPPASRNNISTCIPKGVC